jgi:hypothetical protein
MPSVEASGSIAHGKGIAKNSVCGSDKATDKGSDTCG